MSLLYIFFILKLEYAGNLDNDMDTEWKETEQQHILQLIDIFDMYFLYQKIFVI